MLVSVLLVSVRPAHTAYVIPQAMLVTKYLYDDWKQFGYFTLAPSLPIMLPEDPQSTDILKLQQTLEQVHDPPTGGVARAVKG